MVFMPNRMIPREGVLGNVAAFVREALLYNVIPTPLTLFDG